jgi:hypothetical protein
MVKPGYAVICGQEGLWTTTTDDSDAPSVSNDGIFYIVEDGAEGSTNAVDYTTAILSKNVARILTAQVESV